MNKIPSRILIYKIAVDHGMAPNPFHDVCTLGLCTPNHRKATLKPGDIIVGLASNGLKEEHNLNITDERIIYAMQIDEILDLDSYFRDKRFECKKPDPKRSGIWSKGDNFYFNDSSGKLVHADTTDEHSWPEVMNQDIEGNRVFISKHYNYWGRNAPLIPLDYTWGEKLRKQVSERLTQGTQYIYGGTAKYQFDLNDAMEFLRWLSDPEGFQGLVGLPFDYEDIDQEEDNDKKSCSRKSTRFVDSDKS